MISWSSRKFRKALAERDNWLLLREERIAQLEREIEHAQYVARKREHTVREREKALTDLEEKLYEIKSATENGSLGLEIQERDAIIRQREARIRALEVELRSREAEFHLLRTALDQAEDVLRRRDAKLTFLERAPGQLGGSLDLSGDDVSDSNFDPSAPAAVIKQWQHSASEFVGSHLSGGQELIDPYVVERCIHGFPTRLLIVSRQAQRWYDRFDLTEGPYIDALQLVREGQTVFDCGSHHGVNSLIYSKMVGPTGRVLAFDPFPMNIKVAQLNAKLNSRTNVEFVNVGLSSQGGQLKASIAEQCIALENKTADDVISLKLASLDEFARFRPDFIKIDIEGAEIDALEGAYEVLSNRPTLYVELHPGFIPRFNRQPMEIFNYLSLESYVCFINYPGKEVLTPFNHEFELELPCALFFVPKGHRPVERYYTTDKALQG